MASVQVWTFAGGLAQTVKQPGVFTADEAYVVLAGGDAEQKLYLWAGASAPKDTLSIAATHAAELKASLGASYLRQQQGQEAAEFKQLFPNFQVAAADAAPAQADSQVVGGEEEAEGEEEADEAVDATAGTAGKKKRRKKKKGGAAAAVAATETAPADHDAAVPSPPASPGKAPPPAQAGAATPASPAALSAGAATFSPDSSSKAPPTQLEQEQETEQEQEAPAAPELKQEAPSSPQPAAADSVSPPPAAAATSPASAAKPSSGNADAPVAAAAVSPEPKASSPAAPAVAATATPSPEAKPSPVSTSAKAAQAPPADSSSPEAPAALEEPAAENTPVSSATPKATVEEVGVASVSKAKQQLMNRLGGTATDPLAQKKPQEGGAAKASTYLADSAKAWGGVGGGGGGSPAPLEVKIKPGEQSFGYEELKGMRGDSGIAMASKEVYLSDAEFEKVFGKDRAAFLAMPAWRQQMAKKQHGLW